MATKPTTLPRPWATNLNYATGPFVGMASKADPGVGLAAEGHRAGADFPTAAEHENYQQNLITAFWLPWVSLGSSAGAADAHIVETDADGQATLLRLVVTSIEDATALIVQAATALAPVTLLRNLGVGTVLQVLMGENATGPGIAVEMDGAPSGAGIEATATAESTGACFHAVVPDGSLSNGVLIDHSSPDSVALKILADTAVGAEGAAIYTTRGLALRLTDTGPLGCPLVLTPRSSGPTIAGSVYVNAATAALHHIDGAAVERRNWNSKGGVQVLSQVSSVTDAAVLFSTTTAVQSVNYAFVTGQRYWLEVIADIGRGTGSNRTGATITVIVGGTTILTTSQAYTGNLSDTIPEKLFHRRFMYTAVSTATLAVSLNVLPVGVSGNLMAIARTVNIEGHYD